MAALAWQGTDHYWLWEADRRVVDIISRVTRQTVVNSGIRTSELIVYRQSSIFHVTFSCKLLKRYGFLLTAKVEVLILTPVHAGRIGEYTHTAGIRKDFWSAAINVSADIIFLDHLLDIH